MSGLQKIALAFIGAGMFTSAVLPEHKTVDVAKAFGGIFNGALKTSMTGK